MRERDFELEDEKKRVAMMIRVAWELNSKSERLEARNGELMERIQELEESEERLEEELQGWRIPNKPNDL